MSELVETSFEDVRYAIRALLRSPAFAITVVLTFALGIGANAAMFGIIDRVLLRGPDHVVAPDRVMRLYITNLHEVSGPQTSADFGYVSYAVLRDQARTLERVAAYTSTRFATLGEGAQSQSVNVAYATWDFFRLVGARPELGRFFSSDEDRPPTGERVVVLGHDLWQRTFRGDSSVLGTTARLFGISHAIVGIAPRGLTGVELQPVDAWIPMSRMNPATDWPTTWNGQWLQIVGRLKPGVTADAASVEATELHRRHYSGFRTATAEDRLSFLPISRNTSGREPTEASVARWLAGVSLIVLLIACANVTNLLLARAARRQREIAVRLAIGISRWRLVRLLLAESSVLALAGLAVGILLADWGAPIIRSLLLPDVAWSTAVDGRVLVAAATLTVVAGGLVGLLPALQTRRLDLTNSLKAGTHQSGAPGTRLRALLLFAQCALSMVLLVGAGLFVKSLTKVRDLNLGFQPDRVLSTSIAWPNLGGLPWEQFEAEQARRRTFLERALDRLRLTPGAQHSALAVGTPFSGDAYGASLWVPGYETIPQLGDGRSYISAVTHGYFETTGMRLLQGRVFTAGDRAGSERVTIVNETMAKALWPNEHPLEKCLQIFSREVSCARVVGVVADARRQALREPPAMQYYVPFGQEMSIAGPVLLVRPVGNVRDFVPILHRVLREIDPNLGLIRTKTMQEDIDPLVRPWRVGAILFGLFAALALVVAAIGLYSVVTYGVSQRTQEFGVRLALGATSQGILSLVLVGGIVVTLGGLIAGAALSLVAGHFIGQVLFETSPRDPIVFATAMLVLLGVAVVACLVPARRATRVDPMIALRYE